jgi:acyl-CoA thioester hydrolase
MAEHRKAIEIRWRDLDVYGHVNNAVYLTYLEEGRDEWLAATLGDAAEIWNWVLARVAIDYRRELALEDDHVTATCRLERIGTKSVTTREQILKADGSVAAEAEAVLVARDRESGETRAITAAERVRFEGTGRAPGSGA